MPITKKSLYHGAALYEVARRGNLVFADSKKRKGWYVIDGVKNRERTRSYLYIKFQTVEADAYNFNFTLEELSEISGAIHDEDRVFVALICGTKAVCLLDREQLIGLRISAEAPTLRVLLEPNRKLRVSNPSILRWKTVLAAHNDFPRKLS